MRVAASCPVSQRDRLDEISYSELMPREKLPPFLWKAPFSTVQMRSALLRGRPARYFSSAAFYPAVSQNFDNAEKVKVYEKACLSLLGEPMLKAMSHMAEKSHPSYSGSSLAGPRYGSSARILDIGCGPGELACHFAAKYKVPTVASDVAPAMVSAVPLLWSPLFVPTVGLLCMLCVNNL